jgi:predicted AlkP superfamily pyrophosphatase or phosphodiesterase
LVIVGVYPEHHGIVGNNFYDKVTGLIFESSNDSFTGNPKWWQNHTPIWTTLTHQGIRTSLHRWSRCDIPFNIDDQEILPLKCEPNLKSDGFHSSNETLKEAFKEALDSFKNDTIDAAFIYYPNIDHLGHDHGPNSIEIKDEIEMIDDIIKDVIDNFGDKVNFVIVSDHGMSDSADKTFEKLTDYVDDVNDIAIIVDRFAFSHIGVKDPTKIDQIYDSLQVWDGMNVYKKADIPDSLHFREHPLILDILLVSNGSIMIGRDNANQDLYLPIADGDESQEAQRQDSHHGFNDLSNGYESQGTFPDMRSAFLAIGPAFKANHTHPWIKLVDEYQVHIKMSPCKYIF